jgi:hypothetical protein
MKGLVAVTAGFLGASLPATAVDYFTPASGAILTARPGQVTVTNLAGRVVCYSVNASAPQVLSNGSCAVTSQRLPASSIVALTACGASTVRLAWRDGNITLNTSSNFTMAGADCVSTAAFNTNANEWNAVFQKKPNTPYGWSGGDAVMSVALPPCTSCPADSRNRHFWMFGDTLLTTIDQQGYRVSYTGQRLGQPGAELADLVNYRFGNTIAITGHSSASDISANNVDFDWGSGAWMPLLLDTATLPFLDDLRITTQGYLANGFQNQGKIARVYMERAFAPTSIRGDIIPIYEYYNPLITGSFYTPQKMAMEDGAYGFFYQRIAFYVHSTQRAGTVPLYRYYTSTYSDYLLDSNPNVPQAWFGYTERTLLGYVFPANSTAAGTTSLTHYFQSNAAQTDFLRVYTTQPQDDAGGVLMWPGRAVVLGNDLVHVFSPVTGSLADGSAGGVVFWHLIERNLVSIIRGVNRPYGQWGKTRGGDWITKPSQVVLPFTNAATRWGYLILKDKSFSTNSFVYIYGLRTNGDNEENELVVARVAAANADAFVNFSNWRFYSNGNWVTSAAAASSILTAQTASDFTIHQSPTGRYILTEAGKFVAGPNNTLTGPGGKEIRFFKASAPWGPFTASTTFNLANYVNEQNAIDTFTYYANNAHDGLSAGGADNAGGLLISYVRSCWASTDIECIGGPNSIGNKADVYVPRFINLPWHLIDK